MDDASNPLSMVAPQRWTSVPGPGWIAVAAPIVRSISFNLARRFWLQPCERQDLEQEMWLELLTRHGGRDRAEGYRWFGGHDVRRCREAVRSQLGVELTRIAAALVQSWPFWRRLRPAPERQMPDAVSDRSAANDGSDAVHLSRLQLDVSAFVAELPAADRLLCESLMGGAPVLPSEGAELERRLAALRADFSAHGLHEYL